MVYPSVSLRLIPQVSTEPAGSTWWQGLLGNWLFAVCRAKDTDSSEYDRLRIVWSQADMAAIDQLRMIGNSKEMIAKMKGPALVVALPFQPVSRTPSLTDEE